MLQMSFTEDGTRGTIDTGVPHPESIWSITDFHVSHLGDEDSNAITRVTFSGWHNAAALAAGDSPFFVKRYELPAGPVNFAQTIGDGYAGLYAAAQLIPEPDTGLSFFDGATTV